jgi:hypothetical protein
MDWLSLRSSLEDHDFYHLLGSQVYDQYTMSEDSDLNILPDKLDTFKVFLGWWVTNHILRI